MIEIPLEAIPNQSFSIRLNNKMYDIQIQEANGIMCVSIARDNIPLLSGMIMAVGAPLIPYEYLEDGNFILLTANDEYPYYTEFGTTQSLVYLDPLEVEESRAAA